MENELPEAQPPQPDESASDQEIFGLARWLMWLFLLVFLTFGFMLLADLNSGVFR
jgi:hypothetical protein